LVSGIYELIFRRKKNPPLPDLGFSLLEAEFGWFINPITEITLRFFFFNRAAFIIFLFSCLAQIQTCCFVARIADIADIAHTQAANV
jgi:hypothetical protein